MTTPVTRLTALGVPFTIPATPPPPPSDTVYLGGSAIAVFYVGATTVTKIYLGSTEIV